MGTTVSLENLFSEIESEEFTVNFFHIHNVESLVIFLNGNSSVMRLFNIIRIDQEYYNVLFERIKTMWAYKGEEGRVHKFDSAIAVYLYVLYLAFSERVRVVMRFVYDNQLDDLWWTYQIYNYIARELSENVSATCDMSQVNSDVIPEIIPYEDLTKVTESSGQ